MRHLIYKLRNNVIFIDSAVLTLWNGVGKGSGLLVPFFIASWFGISNSTDSFFFSYSLIIFFSNFFSPVLESIVIPYIVDMRYDKKGVGQFVSNLLIVSLLGVFLFFLLVIIFLKPLLNILSNLHNIELIYFLFIELSPLVLLLIWSSILTGVLNAHKIFSIPAAIPIFRTFSCIMFIFFFKSILGIHSVAYGYVFGELLRFFLLFIVIIRFNVCSISFSMVFSKKFFLFLQMSFYQCFGMIAVGLNMIINRLMASWIGPGNISILEYSERLYAIPIALISSGLFVSILFHWSYQCNKNGINHLVKKLKKTLKVIGVISMAIASLCIIFNKLIVEIAFNRGCFNKNDLSVIRNIFLIFMIGFTPYILSQIIVRAFLVLKNTKILFSCAVYMLILNIILNIIFINYFQLVGIAISYSLISFFAFFYFYLNLKIINKGL